MDAGCGVAFAALACLFIPLPALRLTPRGAGQRCIERPCVKLHEQLLLHGGSGSRRLQAWGAGAGWAAMAVCLCPAFIAFMTATALCLSSRLQWPRLQFAHLAAALKAHQVSQPCALPALLSCLLLHVPRIACIGGACRCSGTGCCFGAISCACAARTRVVKLQRRAWSMMHLRRTHTTCCRRGDGRKDRL